MTCDIVIATKSVDHLCLRAWREIRRLYPETRIWFVVDEVNPATDGDPSSTQIPSPGVTIGVKRNVGIAASTAEIIAFLDSDAYPHKGWIESALRVFAAHPDAAVVGGPNLMDPDSTPGQRASYLAQRSFLVASEKNYEPTSTVRTVDHLPTSNMFVRRKKYRELEGMRPDIVTGEDVEFCLRAARAGLRILHAPDVRVSHKTRAFPGFVRQRFLWGKSTFTVLRHTFPGYLLSLAPFAMVVAGLVLALLGVFFAPSRHLLLGGIGLYLVLVLAECARIGASPQEAWQVFPFILSSNLILGAGALYGLVRGDRIDAYRYYNNHE